MNRRQTPIDDIFRRKLENHVSETPLHLWQGIERQRNAQRAKRQRTQQRRLLAALVFIGAFAGFLSWYTELTSHPALSSFPVFDAHAKSTPLAENNVLNNILANDDKNITLNNQISLVNYQSKATNRKMMVAALSEIPKPIESITATLADALANENIPSSGNSLQAVLQVSALPLALHEVFTPERLPMPKASGCATFGIGKTRFYFDIMAAPGLVSRTLDPKGSEYAKYADSRKETESPRYTYSAELRLSALTQSGFALRTGVNYSEIRERFEHTIQNEVRTIITNVYGQNGEIIGTDTTTETSSRQVVANNRYRMVNIPILAGFEKTFKNVTLAFNGGAYVNVLFKPNGEFLSPEDNRPVSFSNDSNTQAYPAFRENVGVSWYGSIGMQYRISPRLQLLVEPHLKMYPRSFTREDFMTDQKYLTAGVFVGIRHQFQL